MIKKMLLYSGWAVCALAGCTMIPLYQRPAAPVAGRFPDGSNHSGDAADIGWRDFFADPRLKRLVALALENNRDLRVAALTVAQYQAEYRIQRSALFPTIDATANYTRSRSAGDTSGASGAATNTAAVGATSLGSESTTGLNGSTSNLFSVSVGTTSYEVDLFGRVRSLSQQALETYFSSDETRRGTQISLVAQVATQYLDLLEEQEQLALARQTLAAVQVQYDLNKRSFDAGADSELDVATANAQVQTARVQVFEYERLADQAANYLALLVGEPLPAGLPPGRSLAGQGTFAPVPSGLPSDLIARRPDILAAEDTLLAANANIGAARAAFFPVISLTASGGRTGVQLSQLFTPAAAVWSFAPQISLPIFNGGSNLATLDEAKVEKRIEVANYEKAIQTAFREVADALVARDRYTGEVSAQESLVAAEQRRYDLSNLRFRQGADNYLTVLTAQQDLYSAQTNLINTRTERLGNLITLYKALGGGWK
jgi:multidrug efflux system outer membrane protein